MTAGMIVRITVALMKMNEAQTIEIEDDILPELKRLKLIRNPIPYETSYPQADYHITDKGKRLATRAKLELDRMNF